MSRNGSGEYSLPESPFVPGTTISSAAVNDDFSDIAAALTDSIAADGQTPITGPLKFPDGSGLAPSISFLTNTNDGIYHPGAAQVGIALAGVSSFVFGVPSASAGGGVTGLGGAILSPLGIISDFTGATAPAGWFFPYGQAVSRTTYAELFAVIGTTYGAGDGTTTFNLPDLRGRSVSGRDDMGGTAANRVTTAGSSVDGLTVGAVGGAQNVTLDSTTMPTHNHTSPPHSHTYNKPSTPISGYTGGGVEQASQTVSVASTDTTTITIANAGSGGAHLNMQPTMILNKIIFAGHP